MRVFVALRLPDGFKAALLRSSEALRTARPDVRWIAPDAWHLTIAFLGELDGRGLSLASRAAREAVERRAESGCRGPLALAARGILTFPSRDKARVIAAAIAEGGSEAAALAGYFEAALAAIGLTEGYSFRPEEKRPFSPHVTLARASGYPITLTGEQRSAGVEASGAVSTIAVFQSSLGPSGAMYTALEEIEL